MTQRETTIEGGHARRIFLVANGSHGKAYLKRLGESGYDTLMSWEEPGARLKDSVQGEDKPGRAFAGAGATARSAMEYDNKDDSPKEHAKRDLARRMADDLVAALRGGKADSFAVIAPATVANAVLEHVPAEQRRALAAQEHHDLTSLPVAAVFARLDALRHGS